MGQIKKVTKQFFSLLKKALGLENNTSYVQEYLHDMSVRSSLMLSVVVIALELWMIISVALIVILGSKHRTLLWIIQHFSSYVVLISIGIALLVYGIRHVQGKQPNMTLGKTLRYFYLVISLCFGIYISYLDYKKGEQVLTFITMELFAMGLLVWRPVISLSIITLSFGIFYAFCNAAIPASYATKVNLFTTWIAMSIVSINLYHVGRREAQKDERLESVNAALHQLSRTDETTLIANMRHFSFQSPVVLSQKGAEHCIFLYIDIVNFKNYNEKFGFAEGNVFLKRVACLISETFSDSLVARFSDDHFVVLTQVESDFMERLSRLNKVIALTDSEIRMGIKVGSYRPKDERCIPGIACDYARYAAGTIKKNFSVFYCEFDEEMDKAFHLKQYVINHIEDAIKNNYIVPYYQPVVWASTGKLCGVEALARWIDPVYGFLSPAQFIPTLEEYRQIHLVDTFIVERVCQDMKKIKEAGYPILPASVNFSRTDFECVDVASTVESLLAKYGIDKHDIHIEITESALTDKTERLKKAMDTFRTDGYALWLDDFGSGYSGLNVLKEFDFDMMKVDMIFLKNFTSMPKSRPIIRNMVTLANEIGMQTLTEGVETEEMADFLKGIGCQRLQGYLFGKPMPMEELLAKIKDGTYEISTTLS